MLSEAAPDCESISLSESSETLSGSSGSLSNSSIRGEDTTRLSTDQQRLVAAYWPLSRKAAAEIKKRIRSRRSITTEEEDYIDDLTVDSLVDLIRKHPEQSTLGIFLVGSFRNIVKWYKSPRLSTIETLTDEHMETVEAKVEEMDIIAQTNPPHTQVLRKILDSNGSVRDALTGTERSTWNRTQKAEVAEHLRKIYES